MPHILSKTHRKKHKIRNSEEENPNKKGNKATVLSKPQKHSNTTLQSEKNFTSKLHNLPLALLGCFGLSDPLRLAGLRLDDVLRLFDGLEALPDVLVSVLSVLVELCELCE